MSFYPSLPGGYFMALGVRPPESPPRGPSILGQYHRKLSRGTAGVRKQIASMPEAMVALRRIPQQHSGI